MRAIYSGVVTKKSKLGAFLYSNQDISMENEDSSRCKPDDFGATRCEHVLTASCRSTRSSTDANRGDAGTR